MVDEWYINIYCILIGYEWYNGVLMELMECY